jgi:hypothetical protein
VDEDTTGKNKIQYAMRRPFSTAVIKNRERTVSLFGV